MLKKRVVELKFRSPLEISLEVMIFKNFDLMGILYVLFLFKKFFAIIL
jgi:hypothetical protein